jgi:Helicase HerA, central domain
VALILERAARLKHPNLIVFDMHGEYEPLAASDKGFAQGLRIAGPGDIENPSENVLFLPYWLLNQEEMLALLVDRSDQNAPNQAARFTFHVRELKRLALEKAKQNDTVATFTVDSPVPYSMDELLEKLRHDDTEMVDGQRGPKQGIYHGKLTRFINRLETKKDDRRYGFLFQPPSETNDYTWLATQAGSLPVPSDVLPVVTGVLWHAPFTMCNSGCVMRIARPLPLCVTRPISICPSQS